MPKINYCLDPTRDQMLACLAKLPFASEVDEFDREDAIWWFACDWHDGQDSNLYHALSASPLSQSPISRGPANETAAMLYEALEAEFVKENVHVPLWPRGWTEVEA